MTFFKLVVFEPWILRWLKDPNSHSLTIEFEPAYVVCSSLLGQRTIISCRRQQMIINEWRNKQSEIQQKWLKIYQSMVCISITCTIYAFWTRTYPAKPMTWRIKSENTLKVRPVYLWATHSIELPSKELQEFRKIIEEFITVAESIVAEVEQEKLQAVGAQNLLKLLSKHRDAEHQDISVSSLVWGSDLSWLHSNHFRIKSQRKPSNWNASKFNYNICNASNPINWRSLRISMRINNRDGQLSSIGDC